MTFYVMEAANLFCGDHDPTKSKHLTLEELKLPTLEAKYEDHHPGGSPFEVEFEVGFSKLESTFKLKGVDPDVMVQFGLGSRAKHVYTAYGAVRDKRTGTVYESRAIIEARLGKVEGDAFQRGSLQGHEYALNEITHYALYFADREIYYFDLWTAEWRVDGARQNADERRILRIPGA